MNKPLIGLTTYGRDEKNAFSLPAPYLESVRRAGGIPYLIAPDETELEHILPMLGGLILTGGGDINPNRYGSEGHETVYLVNEERDNLETELFLQFEKTRKPIFGICRGMQVINIAWGGSLYPHLPEFFGEKVLHRAPPRVPIHHRVILDPDSRMAEIQGVVECETLSWHHQALDKIATGLKVVGHAPDGVIEALECTEHPWLCAVQWHPELTSKEDQSQQNFFDHMVKQAMKDD